MISGIDLMVNAAGYFVKVLLRSGTWTLEDVVTT